MKYFVALIVAVAGTVVFTAPADAGRPKAPTSDACGTLIAKPSGGKWACTFVDNFDVSTLDRTKWQPVTNFATGVQEAHACYADNPANVSISNGALNLTLRKVSTPVSCTFGGLTGPTNYVSGAVTTHRLFGQQYGRFEARIKTHETSYQGLQEAYWLWPDDRFPSTEVWPNAGEIDISETYSGYPNLTIPFIHYSRDTEGHLNGINTAYCYVYRGVWNTYRLEWSATKLEIFVNGRTCLTNTSGDAAFMKPYIMSLTQMMGGAGNKYDGRVALPATMKVDYVKVWK